MKVCAATVATASSYELIPLSVRETFRKKANSIYGEITIPEHIEIEAMETVKAGGDLQPGQYHPPDVNNYIQQVQNHARNLYSDNRKIEKNVSFLLGEIAQSIVPDLPSDTANKAIDSALSAIVDAKVKLVGRSGNSIRAYVLSSYVNISEAKPENVRIARLEHDMVENLRSVDEAYLDEVHRWAQEERLRIVERRLNPPELSWEQWFKKLGRQAARAMRNAL